MMVNAKGEGFSNAKDFLGESKLYDKPKGGWIRDSKLQRYVVKE